MTTLRPRAAAGTEGAPSARSYTSWLLREPTALAVTLLGAVAAMFVFGYGALLPTVTVVDGLADVRTPSLQR